MTRTATTTDYTRLVNQRVSGGNGADYDTGRVEAIDGDMALVSWDSGVKTPTPAGDLTVID